MVLWPLPPGEELRQQTPPPPPAHTLIHWLSCPSFGNEQAEGTSSLENPNALCFFNTFFPQLGQSAKGRNTPPPSKASPSGPPSPPTRYVPGRLELHLLFLLVIGVVVGGLAMLRSQEIEHVKRRLPTTQNIHHDCWLLPGLQTAIWALDGAWPTGRSTRLPSALRGQV